MNYKNQIAFILFIFLIGFCHVQAQNPNLATANNGASFEASSSWLNPPYRGRARNIANDVLQMRWESENEVEGSWVKIKWDKPQQIKEIWIMTKSHPYDVILESDMADGKYSLPRKVKILFSDGTSLESYLRMSDEYQVISIPKAVKTKSVKVIVQQIWKGSGEENTGICKIKVFPKSHKTDFSLHTFDMYDVKNDCPVQSAKIEIVNIGRSVPKSQLVINHNGKKFGVINLKNISENSVATQKLWIPVPFSKSKLTCRIKAKGNPIPETKNFTLNPYEKDYFDGGKIDIISTNHNDLGWLDIQSKTADYRSNILIAPALDLMKNDSDYKYTMESVEYLKEFFIRHPERKEEIIKCIREKRFAYGASYTQLLQVHVGQENLVRQFYLGKRWFKENFTGCDTHFYINTDVPGITYQLPQILRKSGVDYIVQGRFPWGFYYWQGLDGTRIKMFAFRYGDDSKLINPKNNTGYLKNLHEREYYYKPRNLPKIVMYDFNSDYLPPCPAMIPFAKEQNKAMKEFSVKWNKHFEKQPTKQINPPRIEFAEYNGALKELFDQGNLNIETVKGDWPMSWAYYDEPGHREGLLKGRKGHNALITAEGLWYFLNNTDNQITYPQKQLDQGWMSNCWPDHGWGGNRGILTDQFCVDSYAKSLKIGDSLVSKAQHLLISRVPQGNSEQIPVLVYNSCSWERGGVVTCKITYPENWEGLQIKDSKGKAIPCEMVNHIPGKHEIEIALLASGVPSIGYKTYYAEKTKSFPAGYTKIKADSLENDFVKVKFGSGGISSLFDKIKNVEILCTDKFYGGEVIQMEAPTVAWENQEQVTMKDFDKTSLHEFKTVRAVESPLRYIVEKEAKMKYFTLRERFILNKTSRALEVEADVLNWTGKDSRELRIVFPVNMDKSYAASYDVPFGRVEIGRDEVDFSDLPDNYECQFHPKDYGRKYLPFREAINWVDVSTGEYKGHGCLFASDMNVHLFKDETDNPVEYPVIQHVLLSTRKSFGWNPAYYFSQSGNHHYRMALYPHNGNWRYANKKGQSFNNPMTAIAGRCNKIKSSVLPVSQSFLKVQPSNIVVSAMKKAEDGNGLVIRFYETEGKYAKAKINGFKSFDKVMLTDMLEYDKKSLPVNKDGSVEIQVKPYEIITIRVN